MTTIVAGECFGETDLIAGELARATAIADKPGKLLKIGRKDILEVLRRDPSLASKLLWNLARELGKRLEQAQMSLSKAGGEDRTMMVDIDEAVDPPETIEESTNPRAVVVIPKLTKAEPELVEEIEEFEDVLDEPV
jgi:CRP-like cAMP-binding protein